MEATINGIKVSGSNEEIMSLMLMMSKVQPTVPAVSVDFSTVGIEDSIQTPSTVEGNYKKNFVPNRASKAVSQADKLSGKAYKDIDSKFVLEKLKDAEGVEFWCIHSTIYKKLKMAKKAANNHIKALKDIETHNMVSDDGSATWTWWGYKTKKAAEAAFKTLPEKITAQEQAQQWGKVAAAKD